MARHYTVAPVYETPVPSPISRGKKKAGPSLASPRIVDLVWEKSPPEPAPENPHRRLCDRNDPHRTLRVRDLVPLYHPDPGGGGLPRPQERSGSSAGLSPDRRPNTGTPVCLCPGLFSALTHREPLPEGPRHPLLADPPGDSRDLYSRDGERLGSSYRIPLRDPGLCRTGSRSQRDLQNPGGRLPLRPHPAAIQAGGRPNVVLNFNKLTSQGTTAPRYFF